MEQNAIPIEVLMEAMEGPETDQNRPARDAIREAEVIFGVNAQGQECCFFGMDVLRRIVSRAPFVESRPTRLLRFQVSTAADSQDAEFLAAACVALKGSHCYGKLLRP